MSTLLELVKVLAEKLMEKEVILREDVIAVLGERQWDDGSEQDVGYAPLSGVDELLVTSATPNVVLTAPLTSGSSESFWKVGVAVGAARGEAALSALLRLPRAGCVLLLQPACHVVASRQAEPQPDARIARCVRARP